MKLDEMYEIVKAITYKPGWRIDLHLDRTVVDGAPRASRPYIQISVDATAEAAKCPFTGQVAAWKGGKRYLSEHMCRQEIVGACLGAFKDAEMHEIHEWFKYKGRSIYNPHIDPDALVELVKYKRNLNVRENAMSMEEST